MLNQVLPPPLFDEIQLGQGATKGNNISKKQIFGNFNVFGAKVPDPPA